MFLVVLFQSTLLLVTGAKICTRSIFTLWLQSVLLFIVIIFGPLNLRILVVATSLVRGISQVFELFLSNILTVCSQTYVMYNTVSSSV